MPVPREFVGVQYRQNALTLKIYTDDKPSERRVSTRPLRRPDEAPGVSNPYLDSDLDPTLVMFKADDQVDVPNLLATGAISEYKAPSRQERAELKAEVMAEREAAKDAESKVKAAEAEKGGDTPG